MSDDRNSRRWLMAVLDAWVRADCTSYEEMVEMLDVEPHEVAGCFDELRSRGYIGKRSNQVTLDGLNALREYAEREVEYYQSMERSWRISVDQARTRFTRDLQKPMELRMARTANEWTDRVVEIEELTGEGNNE